MWGKCSPARFLRTTNPLGARIALELIRSRTDAFAEAWLIGVNPGLRSGAERDARRAQDARWIRLLERDGIEAFVAEQSLREQLLREMLAEFNEGRSKTRYSIAATVLAVDELRSALEAARQEVTGEMDLRQRSRLLRAHLDAAAEARSVTLRLRK